MFQGPAIALFEIDSIARGYVVADAVVKKAPVRLLMTDKDSTIAVMSQVLKINDIESLEYSYQTTKADSRPDLFPTEEAILNVLRTMSYEDPAFASIPPFKFFDLSLIQELKAESR